MNHETNQLATAFEKHLMTKGLALNHVASFLRDLQRTLMEHNQLPDVNTRLHLLGWNDMDVDYRTVELAEAYLNRDKALGQLH